MAKRKKTAAELTAGQNWSMIDIIVDLKLPKDVICELGGADYDYLIQLIYAKRKAINKGERPRRAPGEEMADALLKGVWEYFSLFEDRLKEAKNE